MIGNKIIDLLLPILQINVNSEKAPKNQQLKEQ